MTDHKDDYIVFAPEEEAGQINSAAEEVQEAESPEKVWKILVADDEPQVHSITRVALTDFSYSGKFLQILSSYSEEETRQILADHSDIAVVLLDVVMDAPHSGLHLVKFIREELHNKKLRIILRTGQPGQAPEKEVLLQYDINDYKEKTELTVQKLYSAMITSLRTYEHLLLLERQKLALKETGSYLAHLIDMVPSAIFVLDEGLHLNKYNTRAQKMFQQPICDSSDLFQICPFLIRFKEKFHEVLRQGQRLVIQDVFLFPDSQSIWNISLYPFTFECRSSMIIFLEDVTEVRTKEAERHKMEQLQTVGILTAGIAHDFNNLLGGIMASVSLMEHQLQHIGECGVNELLDTSTMIRKVTEKAAGTVKQLLSFSNKGKSEKKRCDLGQLICQAVEVGKLSFHPDVKVISEIPECPLWMMADRTKIEQIFLNICINAVHSMTIMRKDASIGGTLIIRVQEESSTVATPLWRVSIEDNGVGMSKDLLNHIFDPLFSTKPSGQGTGLGLSLVLGAMKEHGGTVQVKSEPGKGSCFSLLFPSCK